MFNRVATQISRMRIWRMRCERSGFLWWLANNKSPAHHSTASAICICMLHSNVKGQPSSQIKCIDYYEWIASEVVYRYSSNFQLQLTFYARYLCGWFSFQQKKIKTFFHWAARFQIDSIGLCRLSRLLSPPLVCHCHGKCSVFDMNTESMHQQRPW